MKRLLKGSRGEREKGRILPCPLSPFLPCWLCLFLLLLTWPAGADLGGGKKGGKNYQPRAGFDLNADYAVHFQSAQDHMLRASDLGAADSKQGIISLWIKFVGGDDTAQRIFQDSAGGYVVFQRLLGATLRIEAYNTDGVTAGIVMTSTVTVTADAAWHHVLFNWDTSTDANCWVAIDGVEGTVINARNDVTLEYSQTGWYFSFDPATLDAHVTKVYFAAGQSLGAFSSANVLKFRSAGGKPVSLGSDGSTPTGSAPTVYFKGSMDPSAFGVNSGTGGNFVLTGTLTDVTPP